jgi:squalene monooxygenase
VLLLERDLTQPDRIVGELLQPGGYLALKRLGLAHCTEGIDAQRVEGYALHMAGRYARVAYPLDGTAGGASAAAAAAAANGNGAATSASRPQHPLGADVAGRSFHHGRFVQRLRAAAASCPTLTIREATVRRLVGADGGQWSGDEAEPVAGVEYRPTGGSAGAGSSSKDGGNSGNGNSGGGGMKRLFSFGRKGGGSAGGGGGGSEEQGAAASGPSSSQQQQQQPTRVARAHLTVVCDGMYSTFRRSLVVPDAPDGSITVRHPSFFVGVVLQGVALPHPNHGHVVLARPSPILFYPISSTEVRCLVDVPASKLPRDLPGYLREVVAPGVPVELRAAFLAAVERAEKDGGEGGGGQGKGLRSMQNKQLTTSPVHPPGALLLGDAFNMRHPLTGGGMTVALSDARLLCDMLRPLPDYCDPLATAEATASFYTARKPVSATINTLANALYKVFCPRSGDQAQEEMRAACFDYLALGGTCASGPVALLSGLNPSPAALVSHFFSVALFGVGRLVAPRPTVRGVWLAAALLVAASRIILPIVWSEGPRAVFAPALAPRPVGAIKKVKQRRLEKQQGGGGGGGAAGVGAAAAAAAALLAAAAAASTMMVR